MDGSAKARQHRLEEALESELSEMDDIGEAKMPPLMAGESKGLMGDFDLDEWDALDVEEMTTEQLKAALKQAGLPEEGKRPDMEDRLIEWFANRDDAWDAKNSMHGVKEGMEEGDFVEEGAAKAEAGDVLEADAESLFKKTVPEIKAELKTRGLSVGGTKGVLVGRLIEALQAEADAGEPDALADEAGLSLKEQILASQRQTVAQRGKTATSSSGKVDTDTLLSAFDSALDEWYGSEEGELGRVRKIGKKGECPGCGCKLQSADKDLPGFVPEHKAENPDAVCVRCYGLQFYGKVDAELTAQKGVHDAVSPEAFRKTLAPIRQKNCIICYVVDVFDFHGTFLPDLTMLVGDNPVVLAVNKADLLPKNYNQERVKRWVRTCANELGSPRVVDVVMISAKTVRTSCSRLQSSTPAPNL